MSRVNAIRARLVLAGALALSGSTVLSSCTVEPYCLVCPDGGGEPVDAGDAGSFDGGDVDANVPDANLDAEVLMDGCASGESCNEADDDCDGLVDEGIDTQTSTEHCGGCGLLCAPIHAFGRCVAGVCEVDSCDVGFIDLDPAEPGCEYRCIAVATDDVLCDFRDDDCDGSIDEDVDQQNDATNCGRCGRFCGSPHAMASCVAGECTLGTCDTGFYDLDGSEMNGCEYACTPADPAAEVCNSRDEDCDGLVDEGDPGVGASCGMDVGECAAGTTACTAGEIVCMGSVAQTTELCNGLDDDCDALVDEGNPQGGRVCGVSTGACEIGSEQCVAGALACVGDVGPAIETCNNLDDDCDGAVDELNPEGGAACGTTTGACEAGMVTCTRGALSCVGGVGPSPELCNASDDDCDGTVDEGDPEAGALCGTDEGRCAPGVQECRMGALACIGAIGPATETCDGTDQDCDAMVDEGNPGGGGACGTSTGACTSGSFVCRTGTLACEGGSGPTAELCNSTDDDCDGTSDEGFALMTDINNCGSCGSICAPANALPRCSGGACTISACRSGFVDLDGSLANGCEYSCSFSGAEGCNGRDDDCDGRTDEGLTAPTSFCNPNGVCAGTAATCGGLTGWTCAYPAAHETTESTCDSLDNDCDGRTDEAYALVGTSCSNGSGTCRTTGTYVCATSGTAVTCNAAAAGTPGDESCNGLDDDCDGVADEAGPNDPLTPWRDAIDASAIPHVTYTSAGRTVRVMQYEASRPDATATSAGSLGTLACSRANVMPWTSVTWAEAQAACCALNDGGTCAGSGGWQLCDAEDWETACEGPAGTCTHSYATSCSSSQPVACNGMEHDSDAALAGDQDALYTTGSSSFAACYANWAAAGRVYDLSGNAKEWTATPVGTGIYQVRGGSYQSIEAGRACSFDFTVAQQTFRAPTTGFRCCMY